METARKWLCVDPGETVGWALWRGDKLVEGGQEELWPFLDQVYDGVNAPSISDLNYLAGLLDGEGCISVNDNGTLADGSPQQRALIQVGMTDRRPLDWCAATFGGKVNGPYTHGTDGSRKDMYQWNNRAGQFVADLLHKVKPHLKVKKEAAETALEFLQDAKEITPTSSNPFEGVAALVVEDWSIYPWVVSTGALDFDKCRTARGIGALELIARISGIRIVLQPATIKEAAIAAGAEEMFVTPRHENRHQNDAVLHGVFYLAANNGKPPC